MNQKAVVSITGIGMVSPAGLEISPLWKACLEKKSFMQQGVGPVSDEATSLISQKLSSSKWIQHPIINPGKTLLMSLYAITECLDQAGWNDFRDDDVILIGTTTGQIGVWENDLINFTQGTIPDSQSTLNLTKQPLSALSDDLKRYLNFHGRIIILASACSASTQAFILAHQMLTSNRAKRIIAGGVEELGRLTINGFGCLKLLNQNPCTPFDQNRMGINLSEGSAFYTIEKDRLEKAHGYILGGDTFLDSYHMTSPNPEGMGLQKAILSAMRQSQIQSSDIAFIHAHGTGSSHNDQAEAAAIQALFPHSPEVVSTKGVHGHALGASGSIEVGLCLKTLNEQMIPPVTGLELIDETIKVNLPKSVVQKNIKYMLKTTLGFGGINSALVLEAPHA